MIKSEVLDKLKSLGYKNLSLPFVEEDNYFYKGFCIQFLQCGSILLFGMFPKHVAETIQMDSELFEIYVEDGISLLRGSDRLEKDFVECYCIGTINGLEYLTTLINRYNLVTDWDLNYEPYKERKDIPIENLDLSVRSYNILKRNGVNIVGDILKFTVEEISKFRNLNQRCVVEITEKVTGLGYELKE